MLPLDKIVELVDRGDFTKAYKAVNQVLDLGPKNVRALKLKALMYACEGRFSEEDALWQRIFAEHGIHYNTGSFLRQYGSVLKRILRYSFP